MVITDSDANGADPGDKLMWKWMRGPMTMPNDFGDPTATADYALCVYDGAGTLKIQANVPAHAAKWAPLGSKGYKYRDAAMTADGVQTILLKGGAVAGKSKILLKGGEANLDLDAATLPLDASAPITVQLLNSDTSACWQSTFPPTTVKKNEEAFFKAKSP
jgi:hypothetical protein